MVALHDAAQARYLNYALSVITSRALPDVRDGLKPVQRRILYTMWQQNLTADAKHRKCAKVVGDVMGNYHPHGDSALYETLVRMAQPFSLRYPLVDGSGNFGSLDGDNAAAMRYTECRLARISDEILTEIDQDTVAFRPNYDGTREEPVVLPARIPNLLVNGATGIAVGMATNIPPHNLKEVCAALIAMIDADMELSNVQLVKHIKGPDFPTGGQIMNTLPEIREIYKTGSGTIRIRANWQEGPASRSGKTIYITSVPYGVNKSHARRAHRRRRALTQAAAPARRQGPVDRRRADCAGVEGRRRQAHGDGVPLQAHAAPVELSGEPDVPGADREPGRLQARAARAAPDSLAVPALPARGRSRAAQVRARGAEQAHPHPRGLRDGLRRARRDPEDRPEVATARRTRPRRSWRGSSSTPSRPTRSSS